GHDYVPDAFRSGAAAAAVSRRVEPSGGAWGPLVVVEDPLAALRSLATWVRDVADPVVVGITGSTGKTSTKDLLAPVASVKFRTVAAERSHNNELGVPLTLLKAASDTQVLVCELGARGPGQIRDLCSYVRPQVGVVTNVGVTHYGQDEHEGPAGPGCVREVQDRGRRAVPQQRAGGAPDPVEGGQRYAGAGLRAGGAGSGSDPGPVQLRPASGRRRDERGGDPLRARRARRTCWPRLRP